VSSRETARRFHFIRQVATGGFGTVFLCKVMHADGFSRIVAVKLLNAQWSDNEEVTSRIRDEARLLGLLRHRHIVEVLDLTSIDGRTAVVMEYLEAVDLRFLCASLKEAGRMLPVRVGLEIMSQVGSALDAAYNRPPMTGDKPLRVIHRDIKPSNIMLDEHGVGKVLDFGVAQSEIECREANTQELQFGSVEYMAPERLFFEPETPASDVYSMGVTLFEILAQERLGKARGRPDRHASHISDRLSFLRSRITAPATVLTELELLLRDSLEFEFEKRPTAAVFHQRAKALARMTDQEDMASWAEIELPPIIEVAQSRPQEASPLSNSIQREDSVALRSWGADGLAAADPQLDDVATMRAKEGERAEALRKGALMELQASINVEVRPATGAPAADGRGGGGPDVHELTDGVGWNDATAGLPPGVSAEVVDAPDGPGMLTAPALLEETLGEHLEPIFPSPSLDETLGDDATSPKHPPILREIDLDEGRQDMNTLDGLELAKPRSAKLFILVGAVVPLVLALAAGGFVVMADVGGVRTHLSRLIGRAQVAAPAPPEPPPKDLTEAMAEGGGIHFESAWEGTVKLKVRCGETSVRGGISAVVAVDSAQRCDVTAMQADRSRKIAVVKNTEIGTYRCFEGGLPECVRQ
jgi:serine/threonine protein kinase